MTSYKSCSGSVITVVPQHRLFVEFRKTGTASRFWKKNTVQAGLFLNNRFQTSSMALFDDGRATDSTIYENGYMIRKHLKFGGVSLGMNRKFRISNSFRFLTGLQFNLICAVRHYYTHQFDSAIYNIPQRTKISRSYPLPDLKGKNYTEWHLVLPLVFEMDAFNNRFLLRPEFYVGIIGGKFRKLYQAKFDEGHGAGISLIYKLRGKIDQDR